MADYVRFVMAMEDEVVVVDAPDRGGSNVRGQLSSLAPQCLAADANHPTRLYRGNVRPRSVAERGRRRVVAADQQRAQSRTDNVCGGERSGR
jgi:hypothetical protein